MLLKTACILTLYIMKSHPVFSQKLDHTSHSPKNKPCMPDNDELLKNIHWSVDQISNSVLTTTFKILQKCLLACWCEGGLCIFSCTLIPVLPFCDHWFYITCQNDFYRAWNWNSLETVHTIASCKAVYAWVTLEPLLMLIEFRPIWLRAFRFYFIFSPIFFANMQCWSTKCQQ